MSSRGGVAGSTLRTGICVHFTISDEGGGGFAIRYDTRCYFNVRSKADVSQLNLPHGRLIYRDRKATNIKRWSSEL